jgi:mannan endo-1,4-beta-mannosidase
VYIDHIYAHKSVVDPVNDKSLLDISGFTDRGGAPVDPEITPEAAGLFQYLRNVMYDEDHVLFGHQQTTQDGLTFSGYGDFRNSDIKAGVNDYPAVFGYDSMTFEWGGGRHVEIDAESAIFSAKEFGAIITLAVHIGNPMGVESAL